MKIWLVNGTVRVSHYMGKETQESETRLVIADSIEQAEEKFVQHFESLSRPYDVSYWATVDSAYPALE